MKLHHLLPLLLLACSSTPEPERSGTARGALVAQLSDAEAMVAIRGIACSAGPTATTTATGTVPTPPPPTAAGCAPGSGIDYPVGPGLKYTSLGAVPWETLEAGATVRIHHRAEPYREKIHVGGVGTASAPIRVCGVPSATGQLPVIDGQNATTRPSMVFAYDGHQPRGLVQIGWRRTEAWSRSPEHIIVEGLEIRNAAPPNTFTSKAGAVTPYSENVAGIFIQRGRHITLRGNTIHSNGNGIFSGTGGSEELTSDVLIEGNYIHTNGTPNSYLQHNVYNEVSGVVYQFNRFGPPRSGAAGVLGANIKERSAGVVIRYNWIEDGAHIIDLVDAQEARGDTLPLAAFHESWVYGNVILRGTKPSGSMIHYGGDSGLLDTYRKGTLRFFHNTVVIQNATHPDYQGTAIFEVSTNSEALDSRNNIYMSDAPRPVTTPVVLLGSRDGVVSGKSTTTGDWIRTDIAKFEGIPGKVPRIDATMAGFEAAMRGTSPGFVPGTSYRLAISTPVKGKGVALPYAAERLPAMAYLQHQRGEARPAEAVATPGAYAAP